MSQSADRNLAESYYAALLAVIENPDCETARSAFLAEQRACLQSQSGSDSAQTSACIGSFLGGTLFAKPREKSRLAKAYALVDRQILTAGGAFAKAWASSCFRHWQNSENPEAMLDSMLFPPEVALGRPFGLENGSESADEPSAFEILAGHPEAARQGPAQDGKPIRSLDLAACLASRSCPEIFLRAFWEACEQPDSLDNVFAQHFPTADRSAFLSAGAIFEKQALAEHFAFSEVPGDPACADALAQAACALAKAFAKLHPVLPYAAGSRIAKDLAEQLASNNSLPEAPAAAQKAPPADGPDDAVDDDDDDEEDFPIIVEDGEEQSEGTSAESAQPAPEPQEHPWRVSCRALAKDLENMDLDAFLACACAFGWHGASCDIGPEPWHAKLEAKDLNDATGETLRSIIELPISQNRSSEPFEGGKHILETMLQSAWSNACATPHGPRLRGICCSQWNYADPLSPETAAVQNFLDRQGPACAAWLLARTAPGEMAAFVRTHLPELAGNPSESNGLNPSDDEIKRAQACAENIANPLWDNERAEAKSAWCALLLQRLRRELGNGSSKHALAGSIRSAFSIMRKRMAAFDALEGSERTSAIEQCGSKGSSRFAALRRQCAQDSGEYHKAGPGFKFAKAAAAFCWGGAGNVKDTLRKIILSRSGISFDNPPEGWSAHCAAEALKLSAGELSKCKTHLPGILSCSKDKDRDAMCAALAAACIAFSDSFEPALEALGPALAACDWSKAILLMPRKEAAVLMLRSVPAAAGFIADAAGCPELAAAETANPEKWLAHPMSAAAFDAWCAACCSRPGGCLEEAAALRELDFKNPPPAAAPGDSASCEKACAPGRPETADIWTPEAWKRFCADIESVDNKDAFASSRSLIKKVKEKKIGPSRKLASGADLRARVDLLAMRFPHFTPLIERIAEFCMLSEAGDGSLWFPPMLMIGGAGIGKTYFSSMLAEMARTELEVVDMGGSTAGWVLTGLTDSWHSGKPGRISRTLIHGACANPVFLLDELDKAEGDPRYSVSPSLLPLLEPHSARHFCDECIPLPIDASRICWLATANDIARMSAPLLSRFDVFELPNPNSRERRSMCSGIYEAVTGKYAWGQALAPRLPEDTLDRLAALAAEGAARDLRRSLTSGCAKAVAAGRREVLPEDLPMPEEFSCDPWDRPLSKERA